MSEKKDENVRVVVRCRPINQKEREKKCKNIIEIEDCTVRISNPSDLSAPSKLFTFDNAYDSSAPTEAIYNDICYSLVENVLEGYNATIFAYGQTGCGKSHTMQGPENMNSSSIRSSQRGIISRSFDHIFEAIAVESGVRYLALVSYLEIYNENIRDLLNPNDNQNNHQLKEIPGEGVIVQGLSTHTVHNVKECEDLLEIGSRHRMIGATLMNVASSRSHSIFTISLEQIETKPNNVTSVNDLASSLSPAIKKGKLNLVDLAGSERQNKTGASGDRLKEATKINLSLSALGNVISALVDGKTKHIPYRDSKLTRLLQDSLGGNTKTLMIACISPVDYNYDETLSTLRYASRAKNIHNKPRINEDPKEAILREYQREIQELRKLLMQSNEKSLSQSSSPSSSSPTTGGTTATEIISLNFDHNSWLENEKDKLRKEYEAETQRLKTEHEEQQKEKQELVKDMERLKIHYENQLKELSQKSNTNNNNNDSSSDGISLNKNLTLSNNIGTNSTIKNNNKSSSILSSSLSINLNKNNNNNNNNNNHNNGNSNSNSGSNNNGSQQGIQQEALNRIEMIKNALIGGEKAYDVQLKEKRYKRKIAAQRRLSALAHALSRVEQSEDRDLLQEHYTDIQQELKAKNESLKMYRQKIRALEREVTDLQSEFQFDRADYLETIRRLERNLKFYQQLLEKALPILRKDGKYWDPDVIQSESVWNDDLKCWKLPEDSMNRFKLPPAVSSASKRLITIENLSANQQHNNEDEMKTQLKSPPGNYCHTSSNSDNENIADSYFRPKRITELIHQNKEFMTKTQHLKNMNPKWMNLNNNYNLSKLHMNNNGGNHNHNNSANKNNLNNGNSLRHNVSNSVGLSSINGSIMPLTSWLPQNLNINNSTNNGSYNNNVSNNNNLNSPDNDNNLMNRSWSRAGGSGGSINGGLLNSLHLQNLSTKSSDT